MQILWCQAAQDWAPRESTIPKWLLLHPLGALVPAVGPLESPLLQTQECHTLVQGFQLAIWQVTVWLRGCSRYESSCGEPKLSGVVFPAASGGATSPSSSLPPYEPCSQLPRASPFWSHCQAVISWDIWLACFPFPHTSQLCYLYLSWHPARWAIHGCPDMVLWGRKAPCSMQPVRCPDEPTISVFSLMPPSGSQYQTPSKPLILPCLVGQASRWHRGTFKKIPVSLLLVYNCGKSKWDFCI